MISAWTTSASGPSFGPFDGVAAGARAILRKAAGTSQAMISRIELGRLENIPLGTIRAVFRALDAAIVLEASWRGAGADRLLDQRHAALVEACVTVLRSGGWAVLVEVSYSKYGERGSIDVLVLRGPVALMVEVKTELVSIEGTIRPIDAKARLAPALSWERFGVRPAVVGRLLVLPDTSSARRQVERHRETLDAAFPLRGWAIKRWLGLPAGPVSGILFLPPTQGVSLVRNPGGRRRVRSTGKGRARLAACSTERGVRLDDGAAPPSGGRAFG